jgi:hypothetical protein
MSDLPPSWVGALRAAPEAVRDLGLRWLEPADSATLRQRWLEIWNQIPFDEQFQAACRSRLERCLPVALGVERARRLSGQASELVLIHDPAFPDAAFASFSDRLPPLLWAQAMPTPQRLTSSLAAYLGQPTPTAALPRVVRLVKLIEVDGREVIERAIEQLEPWLDDAAWCSAFDDDPWPADMAKASLVQRAAQQREVFQEDPRRFPAISYRTLWSRSVLRIERHPFGLWVFELRYRPATDVGAIAGISEVVGVRLPDDLPVDLAASLLRGGTAGRVDVERALESPEARPGDISYLAALAPGEATTCDVLQKWFARFGDDEKALAPLADIASAYQHDRLLFELALTAPEALRKNLVDSLRPKPLEPQAKGEVAP